MYPSREIDMKKIAIHIRVDPKVKDSIDLMAIKHRRSQSDIARILMEYSLEKYQRAREGNRTGVDILQLLGFEEAYGKGGDQC